MAITAMAHKLARILWHLFKYRQVFDPAVFQKEEEKIKRKTRPPVKHRRPRAKLVPGQ
jgi:hypothetical protein